MGKNALEWLKEYQPSVFERENLEIKRLQSSSGSNGHFNHGEDWKEYFNLIFK